jgi:hypothetical protein
MSLGNQPVDQFLVILEAIKIFVLVLCDYYDFGRTYDPDLTQE